MLGGMTIIQPCITVDARARGEREYEALIGSPPEATLAELMTANPKLYSTLVEGM